MPEIKANKIELVPIANLIFNPDNNNHHPKEQIDRLREIIRYQGFRRPVTVSNQSGFVSVGEGRTIAARLEGYTHVPVTYQDYDSPEQEYADLTADNAIGAWAQLDLAKVNAKLGDLGPDFDINMLGIKDFELEPADKYGGDPDEVPEVSVDDPKVALGDLFILGGHRLLCGDSTDRAQVEMLMNGEKADMVFTDPPYGMGLDTDYSSMKNSDGRHSKKAVNAPSTTYKPIQGDDKNYDPTFLLKEFEYCAEIFLFGGDYYRWTLPHTGSWVVWDKRTPASGDATQMDKWMGSHFELCWSKQTHKREIARILHCGLYSVENDKRQHPSQKPVALPMWFFERWGKDAKIIWDGYLGSGSTLIACEKTGRKCFGMEIDPHYCRVILDRWAKYTGKDPIREDGKPWQDLKNQ